MTLIAIESYILQKQNFAYKNSAFGMSYTSDYIIFNLYNLSNAFLSKSASVIYSFLSLSMSF